MTGRTSQPHGLAFCSFNTSFQADPNVGYTRPGVTFAFLQDLPVYGLSVSRDFLVITNFTWLMITSNAEPVPGFEPGTSSLPRKYSTAELYRQVLGIGPHPAMVTSTRLIASL